MSTQGCKKWNLCSPYTDICEHFIDPLHSRYTQQLCHAHHVGGQGEHENAASPKIRTSLNNTR